MEKWLKNVDTAKELGLALGFILTYGIAYLYFATTYELSRIKDDLFYPPVPDTGPWRLS